MSARGMNPSDTFCLHELDRAHVTGIFRINHDADFTTNPVYVFVAQVSPTLFAT